MEEKKKEHSSIRDHPQNAILQFFQMYFCSNIKLISLGAGDKNKHNIPIMFLQTLENYSRFFVQGK